MEQKIIEILEEMEDQFETTGYYGSFAGYGIKKACYQKLAERIVKLFLKPAIICEGCSNYKEQCQCLENSRNEFKN